MLSFQSPLVHELQKAAETESRLLCLKITAKEN